MRVILILLCAALGVAGCAPSRSSDVSAQPSEPQHKAQPPTPNAQGEYVATGKTYRVVFTTTPRMIPMNEPFEISARPERIDGAPVGAVEMRVDAAMPDHHHGMTTKPQVEYKPGGGCHVKGMLLHMPGYWEIYFDIERDGEIERAQYNFELE